MLSFLKGKNRRIMSSSSCLCLSACQVLNQLVHFYTIHYEGHDIEGDLEAIPFNPVPSTIPKWQTFELVRWMQNLHQSKWDLEIFYTDLQRMNSFNDTIFVINQKYEHGRQ
jgi:hypothetical protein